MSELVLTHVECGVQVVRMNRPDKKNALIGEMYAALAEAFAKGEADDEVGVFLILGSQTDFSAGNDLPDFLSWEALSGSVADRFIRAVAGAKKPVVAAVRGAAVGIGSTLLPHCDLVYAAPGTRFHMPFINLGIVPEAGSSQTMPLLAGHRRAAEMLMLGEPFGVETAEAVGLINGVVPGEDLEETAMAAARKLAAKPRSILMQIKTLMKTPPEPIMDRLTREARIFDACLKGEALTEAVAAFKEKRAPDFSKCR
ncbi:Enoyl-CoA hydratase [Paramagnetospirillum magnetotacticum MS-1]|uniref:Enoyl-CoA hydratase n=1 Tax=Paramagnetospirillum magnetotacticum MS-1 TaxID=272627 RepID=A0A0C2YS31_PARME|nr:enoyl-CoA hydratase-related protein [Paramagnetospirillum magnetotacticum]KIL97510.1 Enoyl-CoA hydratase [Paramagnetospirillum magnetotacticum MS-1]